MLEQKRGWQKPLRFAALSLTALLVFSDVSGSLVEAAEATVPAPKLVLDTYAGAPGVGPDGLQTGTLPLLDPERNCPAPVAGNDCSTSDHRVLTNDTTSAFLAVSIEQDQETPSETATVVDDVVIEARLSQRDGADAHFKTLPKTGLPASCETGRSPASSIETDADGNSVLLCNIGRVESSGVRAVPIDVIASGNSANGSSFSLTARAVAGDGQGEDPAATASEEFTFEPVEISASPRLNLVNGGTPGGAADAAGREIVVNPVTGETEESIVVHYSTAIQAPDDARGMASVGSTTSFGVRLDERLAAYGAAPFECSPMTDYWAGRWKLPGAASATQPPSENRFRSGSFSCDPAAYNPATGAFGVTVSDLDTSGQHFATKAINGESLDNTKFVGLGRFAISYPISAILKANAARNPDGSLWSSGDPIVAGTYALTTCLTDFEPQSLDGQANFAGAHEPGWNGSEPSGDNCRTFDLLVDARGSVSALWGKIPASGDPVAGDAYGSPHPENTSGKPLVPRGVVTRHDGVGVTSPGEAQYAYLSLNNAHGVIALDQAQGCSVWDNSQQTLTPYTAGASKGQLVSLSHKVADTFKPFTGFEPSSRGIGLEYGRLVGGGSWSQNVLQSWDTTSHRFLGDWSAQRTVANDCGTAAAAAGQLEFSTDPVADGWPIEDVLIVRVTAPGSKLNPADSITVRPRLETRDTFYGGPHGGDTIPNGSVIAFFAGHKWDNGYTTPLNYNPNNHRVSADHGDKMTLQHSTASVQVDLAGSAKPDAPVNAGSAVSWTLTPKLATGTSAAGEPSRGTTVVATLPEGLLVDSECAAWTDGGAPTVERNAAGLTTLTWHLGDVPFGAELPQLTVCATVSQFVASGTSLEVNAELRADNLVFPPTLNSGSDAITVFATEGLRTELSVGTAVEQKNSAQQWDLRWANTTGRTTVAAPDVLFVLPYSGDPNGSQFAGRIGLTALLAAPTVEASGDAVGGEWLYTSAAPAQLAQPVSVFARAARSTPVKWCEAAEISTAGCPASLAQVTAARFVQLESLGAGATVVAHVGLLPSGSSAGDVYVASFGASSTTFAGQQIVSNAASTRVLGFALGDRLWVDVDRDGVFTEGVDRLGPAGVAIDVLEIAANGSERVVQTVTTSADGSWHAKNLDAGSYAARIKADRFGEGQVLDGFAAAQGWSTTTGAPAESTELRSPVVTFAASRIGGTLVGNGPDGNGFANNSLRLAINPVGTLVVSQLLSGAGVDAEASFGRTDLSEYGVECSFGGAIVARQRLAVSASGGNAVLSKPVTQLPIGAECAITGPAVAGTDPEPIVVTMVESAASAGFRPNTVVASVTRWVSAGTMKLSQRESGGADYAGPTSVNTVLVTCQVSEKLANGADSHTTLYSGLVKMVGTQTKQMVGSSGKPRPLPVGSRCFATPGQASETAAVRINHASFGRAAVVTAGSPTDLQDIRVTVDRVVAENGSQTPGGFSASATHNGAGAAAGSGLNGPSATAGELAGAEGVSAGEAQGSALAATGSSSLDSVWSAGLIAAVAILLGATMYAVRVRRRLLVRAQERRNAW
ncbi:hypothetical protein G7068_09985 [Leucobacter viscericola]|uniref:SD-repeat containing protein B domain-containing protein n=1 Tax=Leucobacter viscericola TaxID=2714935 RepID=A0A6G7XG61_9MICO|nr:hypothetical protein [Leucobacter viscericola]QIK63492.1 hypothetical protein G7068_09985 [Leucobacter viscericola]